jgi:hypothetical protein
VPDHVGVPGVTLSALDVPTLPDPVPDPEPPVKYATDTPVMASTPTTAIAA